ncbi:hypothetical protein CYMTET_29693 [Cymbomonas tetramitiformis]|uniref:Uncharacterized protein n=1 Tax=Cymbomonas tetramitiformis TaxID=36881 RepID=A0AAE0FLY0_9CHLO|nr:hypothetical protein CYMTET_29693 [Cymbomonas tetramitiformis]
MSQPGNGAFGAVEACGQPTSGDSSIIRGLEEPVWKVEEEERCVWFPAAEEQGSPARHSKSSKGHPKKILPKKQNKAARTLPPHSSSLSNSPHSAQSSAKVVHAHTKHKKKSLKAILKLLSASPKVQTVCSRWWKLHGCQDAMGVKEFTSSYVSVLLPLIGDQHDVEELEQFAIEDWEQFLQQTPEHVVYSDSGRELAYSGFFLFFCHELFTLALAVLGAEADDSSVSDFIELTVLQGRALSGSSLQLEFSEDGPEQPAALPEAEQNSCASAESTESELVVRRGSAAHLPAFAGGGTAQETATPGALAASNGECRIEWANEGAQPADEGGADEAQGDTGFVEAPQARGSSEVAAAPRKSSLRTERASVVATATSVEQAEPPVQAEMPNFKEAAKVKWNLDNLSHQVRVVHKFRKELEESDSEPLLHGEGRAPRDDPSPEPPEPSSEFTIFSKLLTTEGALPMFTPDDAKKYNVDQKEASFVDPRMRRKRVASAMYEALFSQERFLRFQRSSAEEIKAQASLPAPASVHHGAATSWNSRVCLR